MQAATEHSSGASAGLRLTVYIPIENGDKLEQLCDYGADDVTRARKTAGRSMVSTLGVIGRAYQPAATQSPRERQMTPDKCDEGGAGAPPFARTWSHDWPLIQSTR